MQYQSVVVNKGGSASVAMVANTSDQVISDEFEATADHSTHGLSVAIEYTAVVAVGITARLQQRVRAADGTTQWEDIGNSRGQVSLPAAASSDWAFIRMHPHVDADAAQMPLTNRLRVVANTGAGDSGVVKRVTVSMKELPAHLQGPVRSHT